MTADLHSLRHGPLCHLSDPDPIRRTRDPLPPPYTIPFIPHRAIWVKCPFRRSSPLPIPPITSLISPRLYLPRRTPAPGFWRTLLGVLIYPVYLLVTLLAIPLPLLLNTLHLMLSVLSTILYPLTSTVRLLSKTFIVGPWGVARSILGVFYPIYTFVGGVIGVGCVMGMGAGWVGKAVLDLIYGRAKKKRRRDKGKGKERASVRSSAPRDDPSTITSEPVLEPYRPAPIREYPRATSVPLASPTRSSPLSAVSPNVGATRKPIKLDKKRVLDKLASTYRDIQHVENAGYIPLEGVRRGVDVAKTTGRESVAIGTRRRVHGTPVGDVGRAR